MRLMGYFQLFLPAIFMAAGSVTMLVWAARFQQSQIIAAFRAPVLVAAAGLAVGAFIQATWSVWRLYRAEHGREVLCTCGGLYGRVRRGRYGLYARCLQCRRGSKHHGHM